MESEYRMAPLLSEEDAAFPGDWGREKVGTTFELCSTHYNRQKQSIAVLVPADVDVDVDEAAADEDTIWKAVGAAGYGETGSPPTFAEQVDRETARRAAIEEMERVEDLRHDLDAGDDSTDEEGRCHKCGATAVTSTFDGALRCAECIDAANNPDRTQGRKVGQTGLGDFV